MNQKTTLSILASAVIGIALAFYFEKPLNQREKFGRYLSEHPFNNRERIEIENDEENEGDRPDLASEQDFLRTMNPVLGRPTPEVLASTIQQIRATPSHTTMGTPGSVTAPWVERGPNNVGGRTRAIVFDPSDATHRKVWAGGVTGGLWYNNDITSATSSWISVNDFWANIAVTSIAFDPNDSLTAYVGTGEGWGQSVSGARGAGIWKTTNGGISWTQITSTTGFFWVDDLVVRNESGTSVIYAAVDGGYYGGSSSGLTTAGLQRSINGGNSWAQVLPNIPSQTINYVAADIEISANNRIWVGTRKNPYTSSDRGGGRILYSDNGTTWTTSNTTSVTNGYGRVELACAPSNSNYVYAIIEDNRAVKVMKKTTDAGATWTTISLPVDADNGIPSTDFSRGQAWYDLTMTVDPNSPTTLITGAIDLFYSTDAGSTWDQITKWSNNNNLSGLTCSMVHSDQHAIVYRPGSSSSVVFGNDGGIHFTSSISTAATNNVISSRNKNYNVTQFYACAMHPTASSNVFLAGAQDNGTQRFTLAGVNATTQIDGGDGAFCFIDQTSPSYQIASYVYNTYDLSTNGGVSLSTSLIDDQTTGKFINPADYDDNQHVLFSCNDASSIWRIKSITTSPAAAESITITGLTTEASHIRVSPYTTTSSTVFIGTDAGKVFKVTNANSTPTTTDISSSSFPTGSVSCIEIGASENELLVTFFNYGVVSVWYTSNGGTTWISKEGNLPDMPVRWALFNPLNRNEVILATELGIWNTSTLNTTTPTWTTSNNGMANVRVDMLQIRSSDNMVIAATHGRGLFSCNGFSSVPTITAAFTTSKTLPCLSDIITLTDTSSNSPTSWTWTITPSTFIYINGTTANSQNPRVQFTASGNYSVSLLVSNSSGTSSITKNNYIFAGGLLLPYAENWENPSTYKNWSLINHDTVYRWNIYNVSGNGTSTKAVGIDNFNYTNASMYRDGLVSPPINLNGYSSVSLSFKHAYRRYDATYQDSMAVYVSTNCGTSWIRVASLRETQLSSPYIFITNSNLSTAFTPNTSADWCGTTGYASCRTINLTPYVGGTIKVKFENISNWGNNLYIDDINVTGVSNMPAPVADFSAANTTVCSGISDAFTDLTTNNPNTWNWVFSPSTVSFVNGTSASSQNPVVTFQNGGNYTVALTASNTLSGNTKTKTNYITVTQSVTPTILINCSNSPVCFGQNTIFTSTVTNGGTTPYYQWKINGVNVGTSSSGFSTNALINNDIVTCDLSGNANCTSQPTVTSNSITMIVTPTVTPSISINAAATTLCAGQNALFSSTITNGGTTPTYQWKINGTIAGTNSSTFSSTTLNNNDIVSCTLTSSAPCAIPLNSNSNTIGMTINASPAVPTISQNANTLTCNISGLNYQWYLNNSQITGALNQSYTILQSGIYKVVVKNSSNCTNTSLDFNAFKTGLNEMNGMSNFLLYPNPIKDIVSLQFYLTKSKNITFYVVDLLGRKVFEEVKECQSGANQQQLNLWFLPKGNYLLQMKDGTSNFQRSISME